MKGCGTVFLILSLALNGLILYGLANMQGWLEGGDPPPTLPDFSIPSGSTIELLGEGTLYNGFDDVPFRVYNSQDPARRVFARLSDEFVDRGWSASVSARGTTIEFRAEDGDRCVDFDIYPAGEWANLVETQFPDIHSRAQGYDAVLFAKAYPC